MKPLLQRIHQFDTRVFLWISQWHGRQLYRLIRAISHTGDGPLYAVVGICLLLLDDLQGSRFFFCALLAYGLNVSSYLLLKNTIKRSRPHNKLKGFRALITPSDQFSFPSGHTAAAFVFATLLLHFYPSFALAMFVWAVLIGLSRVLLGVHYPGDILAGILLGCGAAELAITTTEVMSEFV